MSNQRGEVVTGVMVVMMVGMMIFGMVFMHSGSSADRKQEHSDKGHQHMHEGHTAAEQVPVPVTEESK